MPPQNCELTICFAHVAYQMKATFDALNTGIGNFEVCERAEFDRSAPETDVIVVSGMWHNGIIPLATKLRFIQSIGSGADQFDKQQLANRDIRLASAAGVNARAVSKHRMSLILAMARLLPEGRDNQVRRVWRGMISDLARREDELTGKTLLIIGLGRIGGRLAHLARAFDMKVITFRRDPGSGNSEADAVHNLPELHRFLPEADFVALACPLTPETREVIDGKALAAMKPSAYRVNVARGGCVAEPALIEALAQHRLAGAALDCTAEEPLPAESALWGMPHVSITPHTGGETRKYEANVVEILMDNLNRLWREETALFNQVI